MSAWMFPDRGVLVWPVGNGDAITVVVNDKTVMQFDIHHADVFDNDDDDRVPVVDRLVERLPIGTTLPRLAVLAISHHDDDHCDGYVKLNQATEIDELWITLRSFIEVKNGDDELTLPAQAIYDEACRRRDAEIEAAEAGTRAAPEDRLRVIGNASVLEDDDWKAFPKELLTSAGQYVPLVDRDDVNHTEVIEVFVHTPFRSDSEDGDRNSSSLGVQVTLKNGTCEKRFLILGDLKYDQIEAFVEKSIANGNENRLAWDVLIAPHHNSRNAVCKDKDGTWVGADAATYLKDHAAEGAYVIASCREYATSSTDTDPPHKEAEKVYVGIVGSNHFLMTADYAEGSDSDPVSVVVVEKNCGTVLDKKSNREAKLASVSMSSATVRKGDRTGGTGSKKYA